MLIPKQFQLFGKTYKVKQLVKIDKTGSWGEYDSATNTIKLKKDLEPDQKEQTYLHELMHCILDQLNYNTLYFNEKFVDTVANALHQILKTSK